MYGVTILVTKEVNKSITNVICYNERKIMLQLDSCASKINIIQVYAAADENNDDEIRHFIKNSMTCLEYKKNNHSG